MSSEDLRDSLLWFGLGRGLPSTGWLDRLKARISRTNYDASLEACVVIVTTQIALDAAKENGVVLPVLPPSNLPKEFPLLVAFTFCVCVFLGVQFRSEVDAEGALGGVIEALTMFQTELEKEEACIEGILIYQQVIESKTGTLANKWGETLLSLIVAYIKDRGITTQIEGGYPRAFGLMLKSLIAANKLGAFAS